MLATRFVLALFLAFTALVCASPRGRFSEWGENLDNTTAKVVNTTQTVAHVLKDGAASAKERIRNDSRAIFVDPAVRAWNKTSNFAQDSWKKTATFAKSSWNKTANGVKTARHRTGRALERFAHWVSGNKN